MAVHSNETPSRALPPTPAGRDGDVMRGDETEIASAMSSPALAIDAGLDADRGASAFEAQDRGSRLTPGGAISMALSVLVLIAAIWQARSLDLEDIAALVPAAPLFWLVFVVRYFFNPACDWIIFQRLWNVGRSAFSALVRKLIYNELLLGYLGEAYFYTWARRKLPMTATPFGAVKDVAIMSALAGNLITLALIILAYPYLALLPLNEHAEAIAWSLAVVLGTSLLVMALRRRIFSLSRGELWMVLAIQIFRVVATTLLTAVLWALVLPDVQIGWWLVLSAIRLLVSRLPFVPNKDVVFAGIAVLALGQDVQIAALMAMMAALILSTHLIMALIFGLHDLVKGDRT